MGDIGGGGVWGGGGGGGGGGGVLLLGLSGTMRIRLVMLFIINLKTLKDDCVLGHLLYFFKTHHSLENQRYLDVLYHP